MLNGGGQRLSAARHAAAGIRAPAMPEATHDNQDRILAAIQSVREPVRLVRNAHGETGVASETFDDGDPSLTHIGTLPALYPEWLGERSFNETHGTRFPYIVGEMARGISTTDMVIEAARAGLMGFYGSAGLSLDDIDQGLQRIKAALGSEVTRWGANLIHSPQHLGLEDETVDLFLKHDVRNVSASALMAMSPAAVRFAATGLSRGSDGRIHRRRFVFAKISRTEVAEKFMAPASDEILRMLVSAGKITPIEAELAAEVPVAEDITVEADSGGHTDNRPLTALFPEILRIKFEALRRYGYQRDIRVGAAGGLGAPGAVAAAFAMGAAYVLTGSVNQAACESGLSRAGRVMLAAADMTDVAMAPAADMFELGVNVQVLKRGTLFAQRAKRLYALYRRYDSLDDIPPEDRRAIEKDLFRDSLDAVWARTKSFFAKRDPAELARAEADPKHQMALVFRSYLFMGAQWAREGDEDRRADYQIWCGPAMGAFNAWCRGTFLEDVDQRGVKQIALNLLEGAAVISRAQQCRAAGCEVPQPAFEFVARRLS